jgi:hypothetical protein
MKKNSVEEQVEQSDDQETDNDVNLSSVGDCSVTLERIFSSSFDDYDENDITWKPDDEENSSCSEISTDDACEESDVEEETPDHVVVTTKMNKKTSFSLDSSDSDEGRKKKVSPKKQVSPKKNQKHKVEEEIPDVVVTATKGNKNTEIALNSCDNDEVMKKKVRRKKNRKHKLFHSSRHNIEEDFGSEESTESAQIKQKTDSKNESAHQKKEVKPDESQKKSLNKKKQKQNFFSESDSIENMLPEISETRKDTIEKKKNRKRKHSKLALLDEESDEMIVSKYLQKKVATNENVKSLSLKPSTKMSSGWCVKKMT